MPDARRPSNEREKKKRASKGSQQARNEAKQVEQSTLKPREERRDSYQKLVSPPTERVVISSPAKQVEIPGFVNLDRFRIVSKDTVDLSNSQRRASNDVPRSDFEFRSHEQKRSQKSKLSSSFDQKSLISIRDLPNVQMFGLDPALMANKSQTPQHSEAYGGLLKKKAGGQQITNIVTHGAAGAITHVSKDSSASQSFSSGVKGIMLEGKYVSPTSHLKGALVAKSIQPVQPVLTTDEQYRSTGSNQRNEASKD